MIMEKDYFNLVARLRAEGDISTEESDTLYAFHRYVEADESADILSYWYETVYDLLKKRHKGNFLSFPVCRDRDEKRDSLSRRLLGIRQVKI